MSERSPIKFSRPELPKALDETEMALRIAEAPLYQMKGRLVQLIRLDATDASEEVRRPAGALIIHPLNEHRLLEIFLSHVKYAVWNAGKERFIRGAPPLELARHYLARGMWKLRVLRGIVEAPTLRPDGSLLIEPGYDEASGIYFDSGGVEFPPIPESPSREDALQALELLKDVIRDFPFVPDEDGAEPSAPSASRSVALSAMLTAICRKALPRAPAHGIDAAAMGTGKTLLCDTVSAIATGRAATTMSQGKSQEEFDKRLFSTLLKGDPVVVIDNVDDPVRSDEFCTILTSEEWQCRVLGVSRMGVVPTNVLFLINGNGLIFEGDIRTRVLLCRMDAQVENPEERQFDRDLRAYVPQNRPALVAAALTVLRAFIAAGRPGADTLTVFGRFEEWSNLVRAALVWLGEADPCATREEIKALDPALDELAALLQAWAVAIGPDRWMTAKELIETVTEGTNPNHWVSDEWTPSDEKEEAFVKRKVEQHKALEDALREFCPAKTPAVLGKALTKYARRVVSGRAIQTHVRVGYSTQFALSSTDEADHL